jgi:hypothetical protein
MSLLLSKLDSALEDLFSTSPDEPELRMLTYYMLVYTDQADLKTCTQKDFERVYFSGEIKGKLLFVDEIGEPIELLPSDYKIKWLATECTSVLGTVLNQIYDKLIQATLSRIPKELQGKVKIK